MQYTATVNADQAVITDSVVTGKKNEATPSAKLVAAASTNDGIIEAEAERNGAGHGKGAKSK